MFVFGHDLSIDKQLNNDLHSSCIELEKNINGINFKISTPYHGGQVKGDLYSLIFGTVITYDDNNKEYINEVKNAKEEDYITEYHQFIDYFINLIILDKGQDAEMDIFIDKLIHFLQNNKPKFYTVEASS